MLNKEFEKINMKIRIGKLKSMIISSSGNREYGIKLDGQEITGRKFQVSGNNN